MLYGTRKELNKKLKRMFGNEERYALLVWTKGRDGPVREHDGGRGSHPA
jgi:hypothetical protein